MNIRTRIIITQINHYDMEGNRGLSARVVGNYEENGNRFGIPVSEAQITNVNELSKLQQHKKDFPAAFDADISFVTKKVTGGKEVPTMALTNLQFIEALEFQPKKVVVNK